MENKENSVENKVFEDLLGLSDKERAVYRAVTSELQNVADITKAADLPRMTVHYALKRFAERGLVQKLKREKRHVYKKKSANQLLQNTLLTNAGDGGQLMVPVDQVTNLVIYRGFNEILKMYKEITKTHRGERLFSVQTTNSTKAIYANFALKDLDKIHRLMNEKDIIIEDIVERDFFSPIQEIYKNDPKKLQAATESFLDRQTVTFALPVDYMSFDTDMLIFSDLVVFIDWDKPSAIVVRTDQIVKMCKSFYDLLKSNAEAVQFRELAKEYLK